MVAEKDRVDLSGWGLLVLRVTLGTAMMVNGLGKILNIGPRALGMDAFVGFLTSLSVPAPTFFAWAAALAEALGGFLLVLGLLTRVAGAFVAFTMLMATWLVHVPAGFPTAISGTGYTIAEYTMVAAAGAIALMLSGPGRLSLEHAVFGDEILPERIKQHALEPLGKPKGRAPKA